MNVPNSVVDLARFDRRFKNYLLLTRLFFNQNEGFKTTMNISNRLVYLHWRGLTED